MIAGYEVGSERQEQPAKLQTRALSLGCTDQLHGLRLAMHTSSAQRHRSNSRVENGMLPEIRARTLIDVAIDTE